ncbi:MAG: DNA polymerase III subunit delta [Firmicutes bacterium]|nr:DNA polymerase III subunit delta [Bacillota bacterium]
MNTYLIVSETIYNSEEKLKELKNGIDNIITFNMDENTMDEILQEANYFSMFDDLKCVIVKNAKIFGSSKSSDSNKSKEDANKLLKYLENENKNTKLIFIHNGKVDSKKNIYNIIKDNGNLFLYNSMTKTDMKNELYRIVTKNGYKVDDQSLWYVINNSLGNFDLAINEINKIMIYYSNPTTIKYEDVVALTSKTLDDNNFKLVDFIINRDLENSLKTLNEAKILKVEPNTILSLIYREFRLMLSVLLYESIKYDRSDILKNLKLADWQYNKVKNNLRNYNLREIKEEIVKLSKIDYNLKSGLINKDVVLISYIIDLCS